MPGLCLESRVALCDELQRRVLARPRLPDGSPAVTATPCDLKVFRALALDFYRGRDGRCDPGYRALKAKAGVALGTLTNATRRLQRLGWISWVRRLRYVHGQMRLVRFYLLAPAPPDLRSRFAAKPYEVSKRLKEGAGDKPAAQAPGLSVGQQIAFALTWAREAGPAKGSASSSNAPA
jgi:hypothetical protein